jgi:chromosome transmission fidelity protein 18
MTLTRTAQNYVKRQAHQEIADTLAKSLPMTLSSLFNGANVAVELAPLVTRILSPDLRPVRPGILPSLPTP